MRGNSNRWDPWAFVREQHPDARVVITPLLPDRVLGGVDHNRRIIWLALGLTEVQARSVLAYEIAELQQGPTPPDPCLAAARRRAAEDWASLMLISTEELVDACRGNHTVPGIALALGVDSATLRARFRGLTDDEQDVVLAAVYAQSLSA